MEEVARQPNAVRLRSWLGRAAVWAGVAVLLATAITGDGVRWALPGLPEYGWSPFDAVALGILGAALLRPRTWAATAKLVIGLGLVAWLWARTQIEWSDFAPLRDGWPWFLAAQGVFLVCFVITIVRWRLLLQALGVPIPMKDGVRLGMVGLFFNQFAPGGTGGDLVKAYYAARENPGTRAEAILSVVLDRVIGLTGLMVLAGIVLLANLQVIWEHEVLRWLGMSVAIVAAGVLVAGGLLAWPGLWQRPAIRRLYDRLPGRNLLARVAHALWQVRGKRRLLFASLVLSVANHSLIVITHVFLARSVLGETPSPSLAVFFFAVPVGLLAIALPLTPGGWGVGEVAYQKLFEQFGFGGGLILALLIRATWLLWAVVGLGFYLGGRHGIREAIDDAEHATFDELSDELGEREATQQPEGDTSFSRRNPATASGG